MNNNYVFNGIQLEKQRFWVRMLVFTGLTLLLQIIQAPQISQADHRVSIFGYEEPWVYSLEFTGSNTFVGFYLRKIESEKKHIIYKLTRNGNILQTWEENFDVFGNLVSRIVKNNQGQLLVRENISYSPDAANIMRIDKSDASIGISTTEQFIYHQTTGELQKSTINVRNRTIYEETYEFFADKYLLKKVKFTVVNNLFGNEKNKETIFTYDELYRKASKEILDDRGQTTSIQYFIYKEAKGKPFFEIYDSSQQAQPNFGSHINLIEDEDFVVCPAITAAITNDKAQVAGNFLVFTSMNNNGLLTIPVQDLWLINDQQSSSSDLLIPKSNFTGKDVIVSNELLMLDICLHTE